MADQSNILQTALGYHQLGKLDEAASLYLQILSKEPQHADALHLIGMIAHARGDHETAIVQIAKAILIAPSTIDYHANIVAAYLAMGRSEEAVAHGRRAVSLGPRNVEARYNLGNALFVQGLVDEAIECFDTARRLAPLNIHAQTNYLFSICFSSAFNRAQICAENLSWGNRILNEASVLPREYANVRVAYRPLRIGYYLPEPGAHVSPRFLETLLRYHDREGFDLTVYEVVGEGGPAPTRLRELAANWRDLTGLSEPEQAAAIRSDEIDILNHTATYKARYRMVLVHGAAPLQVASTNLMSTTGLRCVDYVVTDSVVDPIGESEEFYCEKLIRLSCFNSYQPPDDSPPVATLPAADNGFITFGSFNNVAKISCETFNAWAAVLRAMPSARLLLKHRALDDAAVAARVESELTKRNLSQDRYSFAGYTTDRAAYLSAYSEVDIALDPFPFGGGTTSFEALWMGVPVITLGGGGFMASQGAGAMLRAGYPQFIASTPENYVKTTLEAAVDLEDLASVRESLRGKLSATSLNGVGHVAELESAYRRIWQDYCRHG